MNRLLQRQIKRYFGKDFDLEKASDELKGFLDLVNNAYEDYSKEITLLQRTLEVNSEELTQANRLIKTKNLDMMALLEQYKLAIDTSSIVSKTDLKGNLTYVNDRFCELSGYSVQELLGSPHNIIRHKNGDSNLYKDMWQTIQSKKIWRGFIPNRAKNGDTYYVNATVFPILDNKGEIIEYMAIREDVTETVLLQKRSEYLNNRTTQIMNAQESIIIISDSIDGVVESNKALFDLIGFENLEEFKKEYKCICELFVEKDGHLATSRDGQYWGDILLNEPDTLHKAIIKNRTNEEKIFSVVGKEITLDDKRYLLSTFADITELENMRVKAENAEKSKSEFLANMSHEIRTPMNGISGFLQLLEKTELSKQQEKYIEITKSSVKTLLQIINDILDFSKIESGKMSCEMIEVNPFTELEKAFIPFMPNAREKNISYQIHIDSQLSECLIIDELHIRQVMQNLINNAIKFTPEQGTIIVNVKLLSKSNVNNIVRFSVKDSGIGIAKENQENIMSAFSQADNSTTRKFGGTGLGLSISSSLIELMGGTLQLESEINKGSKFYFDLELKKCSSSTGISQHLDGKNVYLVDSETHKIQNIQQQLDHFRIPFHIGKEEDLSSYLKHNEECHLLITVNDEVAKKYCENLNIILISESDIVIDSKNVDIIDSYTDCPSQLYNKLLTKELIVQDSSRCDSHIQMALNILIAEDYEVNQMLLEEHLKLCGDVVFTFVNNGQEALDTLEVNKNFDLILMDINMPVLDGIGATEKIREMGIDIPIVALTANALEGDRERFMAAGMDDYLSKPIDFEKLTKILLSYSTQDIQKNDELENSYKLNDEDIELAIQKTQKSTKLPEAFVMKLLHSYLNSSQKSFNTLQEGLKEKDYEKITRVFHDFKSSSATLHFTKIAQLASEAEQQANKENRYEYDKISEYFREHFEKLRTYVAKK